MAGYKSLTYTRFWEGLGASFKNGKLKFSKLGLVKIKLHREIPGRIKTVTLKKGGSGKWYAVFAVEIELTTSFKNESSPVGIDMGIEKFAALSDGNIIDNPGHLQKTEKKIKRVQRNLLRKKERLQKPHKGKENGGKFIQTITLKFKLLPPNKGKLEKCSGWPKHTKRRVFLY